MKFDSKIIIVVGILCFIIGAGATYFLLPKPYLISASDRGYFSHLHPSLQAAKKSIHIVLFEMRYYQEYKGSKVNLLLEELINAKNRGVDVKVILEGGVVFLGQDFLQKQKNACRFLQESGVEVKFDREGITTHAKLVVIDQEKVFIGSTNWNYYALEHNKETSALIKDSSFTKQYEHYFQSLWRISKEADCELFLPENCSSIAEILARRYECDKQKVEAEGVVSALKFRTSQAGNDYATFKLTSEGKTLKVFTFGHPDIEEDDEVIVKGTYYREKIVSGYTYYDEIEADEIEKGKK